MSIASSDTKLLVFIDNVTEDRCSWMNSEVYWEVLSTLIHSNGVTKIGLSFYIEITNDLKTLLEGLKVQMWNNSFTCSQTSHYLFLLTGDYSRLLGTNWRMAFVRESPKCLETCAEVLKILG